MVSQKTSEESKMKKSDFVHVYIYFPTYAYSGGILYSKELLNDTSCFNLFGDTLLTKDFYDKYQNDGIIDFSYVE